MSGESKRFPMVSSPPTKCEAASRPSALTLTAVIRDLAVLMGRYRVKNSNRLSPSIEEPWAGMSGNVGLAKIAVAWEAKMSGPYDAIVVGARCAGSPTGMLLARNGYRVLIVDRATFPSDTLSTHVVHSLAVAALSRWGLLDRLVATGCPPIDTLAIDFGPFTIAGSPGTDQSPVGYCPRRTILDKLLVDGAREAGAEVRENFTVDSVVLDSGRVVGVEGRSKNGTPMVERARIVIGADGRHSTIAEAVQAERYNEKPLLLCGYYSYWSGVPLNSQFRIFDRGRRGIAAAPTHDGLMLVIAGWPYAEFEANKKDLEGNFLKAIDLVPELAEQLRAGRREARFAGAAVPNYFRKPYGPGWALVGDAGYNRDFITAQGINDAFRDAERCVVALDEWLSEKRSFEDAMTEYQRDRDERVQAMYEFTCQLASLEPPPPEMQSLFAAIHGNQAAMDDFARMNAGTISPAAFFSPENIGAILSAAPASARAH
jgi:2-polyprenyl-6-methoxyphenol hydroxylase-like FAD-dependent oxidoreductase